MKGRSLVYKKGGHYSSTVVPQANPSFLYIVDTVCDCKYSFHLYFSLCCFFGTLVYFYGHLYIFFTVCTVWIIRIVNNLHPARKLLCE